MKLIIKQEKNKRDRTITQCRSTVSFFNPKTLFLKVLMPKKNLFATLTSSSKYKTMVVAFPRTKLTGFS